MALAQANLAKGPTNMPKEGISSLMHGALEAGGSSIRGLGKTMLEGAGLGESMQPADMPVVPSMPKEIQVRCCVVGPHPRPRLVRPHPRLRPSPSPSTLLTVTQLELQHHAIIAASLDGDLYGRDMGSLKGWVVKYKRNLYKDICMPSDHVAAADYMANKVS